MLGVFDITHGGYTLACGRKSTLDITRYIPSVILRGHL